MNIDSGVTDLQDSLTTTNTNLTNHINNQSYPHNTTLKLDWGGADSTVSGYRLVSSISTRTWFNPRLLLSVCSRHQGIGLISIDFGTNASIGSYSASIKYYGCNDHYDTNAWTLGYNTSTGVLRLYWRYYDYSPCDCVVLMSKEFSVIENGEWVESLPSDLGDTYTATVI